MDDKAYSADSFEIAWLRYNRDLVGSSDWLASEWVMVLLSSGRTAVQMIIGRLSLAYWGKN
jgi:hypothetical protein